MSPAATLTRMHAALILALSNLRGRLTRTLLTLAAIALAVTLVVAVTSGYRSVEATARAFLQETVGGTDLRLATGSQTQAPLTNATVDELNVDPAIADAFGRLESRRPVVGVDGVARPISVNGVAAGDESMRGLPVGESVFEQVAKGDDSRRMRFSAPDAAEAYLDQGAQSLTGVGLGGTLTLPTLDGPRTFTVVGFVHKPTIIAGGISTIYVPLRALQAVEGDEAVSKIFIDLKNGVDAGPFTERWGERAEAAGWRLTEPRVEREKLDQQFRGVEILSLMGGSVAMLAGTFIVFTTLSMGVAERQRQLAMLRAIGASRPQVAAQVVFEGIALSVAGAALGIIMGLLATRGLVALFPDIFVTGLSVSWPGVVIAALGMPAAALAAALQPAWRATRTDPLAAMSPHAAADDAGETVPWRWGLAGLVVALLDTVLLFFPLSLGGYDREVRFYGHVFLGLPLLMIGFFLMSPMFVWGVERLALLGVRLGRRSAIGFVGGVAVLAACGGVAWWLIGAGGGADTPGMVILAALGAGVATLGVAVLGLGMLAAPLWRRDVGLLRQQLTGGLWRAAGTASALMVGLGVLVVMQVQGNSAIGGWDLPDGFPDVFLYTNLDWKGISPEEQALIAAAPGIARKDDGASDTMKIALFNPDLGDNPFALAAAMLPNRTLFIAAEPDGLLDLLSLEFIRGNEADARARLASGRHILITEEFHRLKGYDVGDAFPLRSPQGTIDFTVAGVVYSPGIDVMVGTFDLGDAFEQRSAAAVFGTLADARSIYGVENVRLIAANLEAGVDKEALVGGLRETLGNVGIQVADVRALKEGIQGSFRRILLLASTVAWSAMLVASLGVTNTIVASVRTRQWHFGLLRSLGVTRLGLLKLVLTEAALLGLVGMTLGLSLGLLMAVNARRVTAVLIGFSQPVQVPWGTVGLGALAVVLVSVLAAAWPAVRTARASPLGLLQAGRAAA